MDSRLSIEELAKRWRCTVGTLYLWRHRKLGVKHHKEGRKLFYDLADVEEYERKNWSVRATPLEYNIAVNCKGSEK
jgi:DNA-binding transcriptional MerR regulator